MSPFSRKTELAHFSNKITWLSPTLSAAQYHEALEYCAEHTYGLNTTRVAAIQTHRMEDIATAQAWLAHAIPESALRITVVLGNHDVFQTSREFFLANWPDMLTPGRDDAILLAEASDWIGFYCHDDWLQCGRRSGVEPSPHSPAV